MDERIWTGLTPAQADGQACVVCGRNFRLWVPVWRPAGRSDTGSQVFACSGGCAPPTLGALGIPSGALTAAGIAFLAGTGGDPRGACAYDVVAPAVAAAAPLIVAAELARLADEHEPRLIGPSVTSGELSYRAGIAAMCAVLRERATGLDPARGGGGSGD